MATVANVTLANSSLASHTVFGGKIFCPKIVAMAHDGGGGGNTVRGGHMRLGRGGDLRLQDIKHLAS